MKKTFITSCASNCSHGWNDDTSLDEMIKVVTQVLTTNEELQVMKHAFLDSFRKTLLDIDTEYWSVFEEKYLDKFGSWCAGGIEEFKKTISIDAIFDKFFGKLQVWYRLRQDECFDLYLPDLDKCLKWYFTDIESVRKYKLSKTYAVCSIDLYRILIELNDDECFEILLKWFVNND